MKTALTWKLTKYVEFKLFRIIILIRLDISTIKWLSKSLIVILALLFLFTYKIFWYPIIKVNVYSFKMSDMDGILKMVILDRYWCYSFVSAPFIQIVSVSAYQNTHLCIRWFTHMYVSTNSHSNAFSWNCTKWKRRG